MNLQTRLNGLGGLVAIAVAFLVALCNESASFKLTVLAGCAVVLLLDLMYFRRSEPLSLCGVTNGRTAPL